MGLIPKILLTGMSSLIICACSQNGAEAQSTSLQKEPESKEQLQANWTVDQAASSLTFTGSMSGDAFSGSFPKFNAQIRLDPDDLDEARIKVTIPIAGIDADDQERNEALPGKEWFAANSFPNAVFASNIVNKIGDTQYEAVGELTIKDVTHPLILPFSLKIEDGIATADAKIEINRSDFGIGTGMWKNEDWVAHKVQINIAILAAGK